jgi:hypothetical protein
MRKLNDQDRVFAELVRKAETAGNEAGHAALPVPMIVGQAKSIFSDEMIPGTEEYIADGVCGFAWVKFPGNTPFGRYMKRMGKARTGYPKGLSVHVSGFGQSMQRKEAYARAYAKVLRDGGVEDAYADSRMD